MALTTSAFYEYSKRLKDERVDEDDVAVTIGSGRSRREVTSHDCMVRGIRERTTIVVTHHEFHQPGLSLLWSGPCLRNVLEVFVADGMLPLECVVRRKNLWERFTSWLLRRKAAHALLAGCVVQAEPGARGRSPMSQPAFLDAVWTLLQRPEWVSIEFQAGTGATALLRAEPTTITADVLDAAVQATADVVRSVTGLPRA